MKLGALRWIAPGVAAAALLALSAVAATAASPKAAPASASTAAAPANSAAMGKAVFQDMCGTCHDLAVSTDQRKTREAWQTTVSRMVTSGAALSDDEVAQVVDYLAKNYGAN